MRFLSILLVLAGLLAVTLAVGQYYVPRAYYTIDETGHESAPVPLRRLRRSLAMPLPYYPSGSSGSANANANAYSNGGTANANAYAYADHQGGGRGGFYPGYQPGQGSGLGQGLGSGYKPLGGNYANSAWQGGPLLGRSATADTSVSVGPNGEGFYSQYASSNP